jgi:hypothetical protein
MRSTVNNVLNFLHTLYAQDLSIQLLILLVQFYLVIYWIPFLAVQIIL